MVYVNIKLIVSGFFIGAILGITLLILNALLFEPKGIECTPSCTTDALGELSNSLQRAKLGLQVVESRICLSLGESITNSSLAQSTGVSSLTFVCSGSICRDGIKLSVTPSSITALRQVVFKVHSECELSANSKCIATVSNY